MAGSKLPRIGSIYERLTGIIRAGAMKEEDIPIWYEVYKAFPPKYNPAFTRPPVEKEIKPIYYPEDIIRGKFSRIYGSVSVHNLLNPSLQSKSVMQRFVEKYQDLEKSGNFSNEEDLFKATEDALEDEGITFVRNPTVQSKEETLNNVESDVSNR